MSDNKICSKDYIECKDDKKLSKTRRKVNAKSYKKRVYGVNHPTTFGGSSSGTTGGDAGGDAGGMVGEMHNGVIPGVSSADGFGGVSFNRSIKSDTRQENRRNAPQFRSLRSYLQFRNATEEEEDELEVDSNVMGNWTDDESDDESDDELDFGDGWEDDDDMNEFDANIDVDDYDEEDIGMSDDELEGEDDVKSEFNFLDLDALGDDEEDFEKDEFDELDSEEDLDFGDDDLEWDFGDEDEDNPVGDPDEDYGKDSDEIPDDDFEEENEDLSPLRRAIDDFAIDDTDEDDEPMNDFDRFDRNDNRQAEINDFFSSRDDFEKDEFANYDSDEELDFENEEEDYAFDQTARDMVSNISDETIEQIDDATGTVSKWWREQIIQPDRSPDGYSEDEFYSDDEFEEEEEGDVNVGQSAGSRRDKSGPTKKDQARMLFQQLINQQDIARGDIIAQFVQDIDVTHSTAVSYYELFAKEAGITGKDNKSEAADGNRRAGDDEFSAQGPSKEEFGNVGSDEMGDEELEDEGDRRGIIRQVDDAHLVYKRQTEDGSFEELWIYNSGKTIDDDVKVRHAILAGTDIPRNKTQSDDGSQRYELETMGNGQMLHIIGLPN